MVEVTLARLGKLLLEPTYEIVVKHGSAFDSFQAYDRPSGHRRDSDHPGGPAPATTLLGSPANLGKLIADEPKSGAR